MKRLLLTYLMFLPAAIAAPMTAEQMQAALKTRPEVDEIRWKDPSRGAPLKVRILRATSQVLEVEKQLATGLTQRTVPLADLAGLEFTRMPGEIQLHQNPAAESVVPLRVIWEARKFTVGLEGSNASLTGIALAKSLRLTNNTPSFDEAGKILDFVISKEHATHPKSQAMAESHTVAFVRLIQKGVTAEADRRAWEITEEDPADNPELMLLATGYQADRHFIQLKAIEEDNPRWTEDPEIKPQRDRIYHLALDFALYPSLFHGSRQAESAAGLAKAASVYQFTREATALKGVLQDLIALYPESTEAVAAAPMLAKLVQQEASGKIAAPKPDEPTSDSPEADGDSPPVVPPPPKRYSIFSD